MPDLERLTDNLREHLAKNDPLKHAFERGFTQGKTGARLEIAAVCGVLGLIICLAAWVIP